MPVNLEPTDLQKQVRIGFQRMANFRSARIMFMRAFLGQYYDKSHGEIGREPMNLIFNAIRVLLPQIVMSNPKYKIKSEYTEYRDYADLLALGLNFNSKQLKLHKVYRLWLMDAILGGVGIMKTGLADSGSVITFDNDYGIDPGQIYSDHVDFDNFVFDPTNTGRLEESNWMGDRIRVDRQYLLDSGLYENDLVERLPSVSKQRLGDRASDLSTSNIQSRRMMYDDQVEICEIHVRGAETIVTVPAPQHAEIGSGPVFDRYLREVDAYVPDDGPYTFLSITPPVPSNPMAVAPVGVWYDLHVMANRMIAKTIDQADRQKDLVLYRRTAADDAQEALDAPDGHAVGLDDPQGINVVSFGGQKSENLEMVSHLQMWFNTVAANPQGIGGQALDADSATEAQILQTNADTTLNDVRDLVYQAAAEEGRKRAFYLHTDPLLDIPLARRKTEMTESGPQPIEEQVRLTPEVRRGDFLDFTFEVEPESMERMDTQTRLTRLMDFIGRVLPSAMQTGMMAMNMGLPFNIQALIERSARDAGIDWFDEVWFDPTFQQRLQVMMSMGPQPEKGQVSNQSNGQPRTALSSKNKSPLMQQFQAGAAPAQATLPTNQSF